MQKRTEEKTKQLAQVAAAAPAQASEMASYLNKRAKVNSEAVTGDGDLVADLKAGRTAFSALRDDDLPANLRAMKPEEREAEINRQMEQRKALNEKLAALVAKRDKYVAEQQAKAPPKASFPHYDLTASRRAAAIAAGAVELDRRAFVMRIRELRAGGMK